MTSSNLLDCTTGRSAGLAPLRMGRHRRQPDAMHHRYRARSVARLAGVAAGTVTGVLAGTGSAVPGSALSAPPRGQLKSSARPLGAETGSPLVSTRVAIPSVVGVCRAWLPPSSSSAETLVAVSGTTGPATGRCKPSPTPPPCLAFGAGCGPCTGSATGTLRLARLRSISLH
jgi:hypothetical protein